MHMTRLNAAQTICHAYPRGLHTLRYYQKINTETLKEALECAFILTGATAQSYELSHLIKWARRYVRTHGEV